MYDNLLKVYSAIFSSIKLDHIGHKQLPIILSLYIKNIKTTKRILKLLHKIFK